MRLGLGMDWVLRGRRLIFSGKFVVGGRFESFSPIASDAGRLDLRRWGDAVGSPLDWE